MTAVQVHEPAIYSEIHRNRSLFTGKYGPDTLSSVLFNKDDTEYKKQLKEQCEEILKRSVKIPVQQLREIVGITFPKIADVYSSGSGTSGWETESEWRQNKRICSPEHFNRYFKLLLSADEFSQKEIDRILSSATDTRQFLGELKRLKDENRLAEFLDTLPFLDRSNSSCQQITSVMTGLLSLGAVSLTAQRDRSGWPMAGQISRLVFAFSQSLNSLEERFQVSIGRHSHL